MIKHTLQHGNAHTAIFLKYVWPFFNAMHKRVNPFRTNFPFVSMGRIEIKKSIFVQKQSKIHLQFQCKGQLLCLLFRCLTRFRPTSNPHWKYKKPEVFWCLLGREGRQYKGNINLKWISSKTFTAQKMKFSIKYFFSKCDQIHWKLRIWSHLLKCP